MTINAGSHPGNRPLSVSSCNKLIKTSSMIKYPLLIAFIILLSCSSKNIGVTEKEVAAVQKVLGFYGGVCLRHKGLNIKSGVKKRNFELEMSKSPLLENPFTGLNFHSANIAYLFYSNLGTEQSNYEEVKVTINQSNGKSSEFVYTNKDLTEIEQLNNQLQEITGLIVTKDYANLIKLFDRTIQVDKDGFDKTFSLLETKFGNIRKMQFQGFEFRQTDEMGQIIIISEALVFEKITGAMNLVFKRDSQALIGIQTL
jgi:hypothetical protein